MTPEQKRRQAEISRKAWAGRSQAERDAITVKRLRTQRKNVGKSLTAKQKAKREYGKRYRAARKANNGLPLKSNKITRSSHARSRPRTSANTSAFASPDLAYLYGKVETLIEHYAASSGLAQSTLVTGLAALLHARQGR